VLSSQRCTDLDSKTLTGKVIDYRQGPESAAVGKSIGHEIHAPALILARRRGTSLALNRASAASRFLRTHRQVFLGIEPVRPFVIDPPTLPQQQDV